jgi:hypothetical protein
MSSKTDKPFPANPQIATFRYRGPDRRKPSDDESTDKVSGEVTFDAKGNPVWEIRVDVPRRRKEDDTVDLLKCLDTDSLSIADDDKVPSAPGYNPYERKRGS